MGNTLRGGKRQGAGRPKKGYSEQMPIRSIRVSDSDWARIEDKAAGHGMTVSEYIRDSALRRR